jgi:hypothetical protein
MALVLTLREGDDFYVEDQRFVVLEIYSQTSFRLNKEGHCTYEVTEYEGIEVIPDVFVSSGDYYQNGVVRVVIDAPRSVLILRGAKYREMTNDGHEGLHCK